MIDNIKILGTEILSDERYVLKKITYEYGKPDGSLHKKVSEVYDRGNAAAILLYHKERKTVILTKQFGLPSFINGNNPGTLIEACAGKLEQETPEECVIRETREETGYEVSDVQRIFEAYMSPGCITEILYFFIAGYSDSMKVTDGGGAKGEEENIEVLETGIEEAMEMINNGSIKDAKTIMLLQYVKLHNIL